ncbi:MAG: adenylate/guanylate cyclase domain-containing protein, partial [Deltaproteobacteria bacterium]|nr:adenylate/guanylate cyclase domain-containing protein [Deltaproteobacteria bacterium]
MMKKLLGLSGFKIGVAITLFMTVLFFFSVLDPQGNYLVMMDKKWVDYIQKERDVQPHSSDVVIVTVDAKSVDKYGRWPWPRSRMAELVAALNDHYKVTTIGFDIVFSEPEQQSGRQAAEILLSKFKKAGIGGGGAEKFKKDITSWMTDMDGDSKFASTIAKRPNTILGFFFNNDPETITHLTEENKKAASGLIQGSEVNWVEGIIPFGAIHEGLYPETNIPKIVKGGHLSGFFNMVPDPEDGMVRRVHLLMRHNNNVYPSLDLQMLRHYFGDAPISVLADENSGIMEIDVGDMPIYPNLDGSILLNYKGPSQTFPHYSIYDVVERTLPVEALEGKLVLVGATETGIYDLRTAPVGAEYPGVEVHATLLDNLITGTYFSFSAANDLLTAVLLLVVGLLLGFILPRLKNIYGTLLTVVLVVVYLAIHRWMVMELLTWTSAFFVVMEILLVWGAITLYQFLVSDRDKRFIKGAFQQYLSPQVIEQLMDNPNLLKLGGERRVMTAFFSDVAGFSSISEVLEPEQLVALLNEYLTEMSNIIMKFGGTVDKYEGDAIIAFFGAPIPYEDHAVRGCLVALEMQHRLKEMRDVWKEQGRPELTMRVGLNTGTMVVGNMGSENRFDYTMMGNAVNLASRLEGANKNYGTHNCMSEMTYEPVKDQIEGREMDLIRVMGISTPVRIYEILSKKGELSESVAQGVSHFEKGLELYRAQQWDKAI